MTPVQCIECGKEFKDVGAFINHMSKEHRWIPTKSLIFWGDYYRGDEDTGKQGETTQTG